MRYKDGQFTTYTTADGLPHNQVARIQPDLDGRPLVNTYQGIGQWQGSRFRRYAPDGSRLHANNKGMVLLDRFGGVWYEDGVAVHRATPAGTTTYTRRDGLADPNIWSVFQDRQGVFWLGTKAPGVDPQQKGLLRIQDGRVTVYIERDGLPDKWVSAFCEDREGTLRMGTNGSGLVRFRDGQFTTYTTADGLPSNNIMAICEDREGNIWLVELPESFSPSCYIDDAETREAAISAGACELIGKENLLAVRQILQPAADAPSTQ